MVVLFVSYALKRWWHALSYRTCGDTEVFGICRCSSSYHSAATTWHLPIETRRIWQTVSQVHHKLLRHYDVIKWKHFPRYWPFVWGIHRSPVNSPHKGQWRRALMFSLIRVWINGWVNNREAGDLRRYRSHYDVTVMGTCGKKYMYDAVEVKFNDWVFIKLCLLRDVCQMSMEKFA